MGNNTIGDSLVIKGTGPIMHDPSGSESLSYGKKTPAEKQLDVVISVLKENNIEHRKEPGSLEVLYNMLMNPKDHNLGVNCVSQIHLNIKTQRPEFIFTDMLLGVEAPQEHLSGFCMQLCNMINDFSATNGGFLVYSPEIGRRFRYRNGMLLPEGELPKKMMQKLFYYSSIVIDGFFATLLDWANQFGLQLVNKTDSYYQLTDTESSPH